MSLFRTLFLQHPFILTFTYLLIEMNLKLAAAIKDWHSSHSHWKSEILFLHETSTVALSDIILLKTRNSPTIAQTLPTQSLFRLDPHHYYGDVALQPIIDVIVRSCPNVTLHRFVKHQRRNYLYHTILR